MPKELIHFKVAEMTAAMLTDTRFAPCLAACPQGLLLGAVFHDTLYYGITPTARPMEKVAHILHGINGQDTYTLLRLQAHHAAITTDRNVAAALLTGMVSHLCTDIIMHPMVWYLTGDYYAAQPKEKSLARQRHRALESLMDMTACPEMMGQPRYKVKHQLKSLGVHLFEALPMTALAGLADVSPTQALAGIRSAFRVFAQLQNLFPIRPLARILHTLSPWLPNPAKEITALFYAPQLLAQADRIKDRILYNNPVSGRDAAVSLAELMATAANRAAELCHLLEPAVFDNVAPTLPNIGPSLDSGMPNIGARHMHHQADPPFPKLP